MQILIAKPGMVDAKYREKLEAAGIFLLEIEDPSGVRLMRCEADLQGSELLRCAGVAISKSDHASELFGREVAKSLSARSAAEAPGAEGVTTKDSP